MTKQVIKVKKELPNVLSLPQGWKKAVATSIGVHQNSMSRILKAKKGPNYLKLVEAAKSLYGKVEY